jgi:hypothetical protein
MISINPVPQNAQSSIRDNREPDSKITEESDLHSEKQESPNDLTDEGRMRAFKRVEQNDLWPIRDNLERCSNAIDCNFNVEKMHLDLMNSIAEGSQSLSREKERAQTVET